MQEYNYLTQIKLLGVTIQDNLKWESHVTDIIYRASRRLYTLCILKKFNAPLADLVSVYTSYILVHVRPIMEYACQVWHIATCTLADNYAIELKVFKNVLAELLLAIRIMTFILRLYNF